MGDGLGVLVVRDLERVDQSTLVPLRLGGEVKIVLHSHEDVAELVRDLVGLDAEDVVRRLVEPVMQVVGAGGELVHRLCQLLKRVEARVRWGAVPRFIAGRRVGHERAVLAALRGWALLQNAGPRCRAEARAARKRIGGLPWLPSRIPSVCVTMFGKQIRAIRPMRDDLHALLAVVEERLGAIMLLASFGHPYRVPSK